MKGGAWLFVPAASERFITKLVDLRPDVAVLDLEDGTAPTELEEARERVSALLAEPTLVPLAVRTHAVTSPEFPDDVNALGPSLHAVVVPKVMTPGEVREAVARLDARNLPSVRVIPMIESAVGLARAHDILTAHPAVGGVALGGEDLAADIGLPLPVGEHGWVAAGRRAVIDAARTRLVLAAAVAGVALRIDTPHLTLRDGQSTKQEAEWARALGFTAKFAVHPAQIEAIRSGMRPSEEEVLAARAIISGGEGRGADRVGGKMVDEAVVRQARTVLGEE